MLHCTLQLLRTFRVLELLHARVPLMQQIVYFSFVSNLFRACDFRAAKRSRLVFVVLQLFDERGAFVLHFVLHFIKFKKPFIKYVKQMHLSRQTTV